jgi:DNA-binding SARP family transcriptional activator
VEFRVLGPLEAIGEAGPVELGGPRQRALLALLLLHANEVVPADRLIDELWPNEPPQTGRAALRVRVSQLRKALGADAIVTRPPGYVLAVGPDQLDLFRFERLAEEVRRALEASEAERARGLALDALALWRGPPLADVADLDFGRIEAGRLEELRLAVLERRIEADLALGRHDGVVGELETLAAQHPLREHLAEQLMLALYRSGRQAEALGVYQRARRALVDELGIEPSESLKQLEAAILRHEPSLAAAVAERPGAPTAARSVLVVLDGRSEDDSLVRLAETLARQPRRELILCMLVADPDGLVEASEALHARRDELIARGLQARAAAFTSPDPGEDVVRLAVEQDVELALVRAPVGELAELPAGRLGAILDGAPCDVAVVSGVGELREGSVLVPFSGAEHDWSAVELGAWLAQASEAKLILAGTAAERRRRRDASRLLASASLIVQQVAGVAAEPLLVRGGIDGVVAAGGEAAVVVVGLSDRWRREGVGEARLAVANGVAAPVLLVRRGVRPGGLAPPEGLTRFTWTLQRR